jgi:phenylalanyl-tRNA synthetase beta chain
MKLSMNWLKEFVNLPADLTLEKIAYDLTMATVEVEGWEDLSKNFDKIVVGVVNEIAKHPDADKLTLCKVDIGGEVKEIVCGGINLREGMKVAVSLPGAKVRWHGAGELVEIKKSKVRGVESFGMICASSEIGLFDLFPFTDDGLICDLSAFSAAPGTNVAAALGIDDVILEIDNKSLTNRPDLWGHYGIARELSAFYGVELKEILPYEISAPQIEIELHDTSRSARYIGVQIEGLSVKPSPFEIQTRLWRVGLRPINAIVDITNYVMLATGQPTHAFDSERIAGHITVRRAKENEKLLLLDEKELTLCNEDLVIADDEGAVGLAGVMGGKRDSVLPETSKIILEIANFNAMGIRRTASRYDARTDAAIRFEKGIDPERAVQTLPIAMRLFSQVYPEMKITGFRDNYAAPLERKQIDVSLTWLEERLGKRLSNENISRTLSLLGFDVKISGDTLHVIAPTWRSTGDISIPDDIMEELARMHGYENFDTAPIVMQFTNSINQPEVDLDRKIREYLAYRSGMREILTYPWFHNEFLTALYGEISDAAKCFVSLSAPPSPDEKHLRSTLLPNICKAAAGNARYYNEFAIFESGQVFCPGEISEYDPREKLPKQSNRIGGAFVGGADDVTALFRRAKGILEAMPRFVHFNKFAFEKIEKPIWADETVWLNILQNGENIGSLALLSKKCALACGIKNHAVMLFEFCLDAIKPFASRENKFVRLPDYPMTDYDQSLLFAANVKWADIADVILAKKGEGDILRGISFVDEYRGKQIPDGKKSVTFRLTIGSLEKTLTSNEIENFASSVVKRLSKQLGAEARA